MTQVRSVKKFVRTTRHYRSLQIRLGENTITAEDPATGGLRDALA